MTNINVVYMDDPEPKFRLGRLVITKAAEAKLTPMDVSVALLRHVRGDWGDVSESDREENELSLTHGSRLLSVYHGKNGTKFWIITEADRRVTTVLLPEDY